ncbi:hypothetical protein [Martelella alba]|uniref:Uncharacterized protein n=1 Tax=Martelella alba TaxID=2590451 RepID=A0ABY2SF73_9HYPH|nr:hypothetical protein [Martelella alba]TKI02835.1 hypothetical protein FCN80_23840 [Martelella alba]
MHLDVSRYPLVFIDEHTQGAETFDDQFEQLLSSQRFFVLITAHSPHHHHDETAEERAEKTAFLKRIRARMRQYCLGIIIISIFSDKPLARVASIAAGKAFSCPIIFVDDEEQAIIEGQKLLGGNEAELHREHQ